MRAGIRARGTVAGAVIAVRLFAAAAEAVGANDLPIAASSVGALRAALGSHGESAPSVIAQCAVLRAGVRLDDHVMLVPGDRVDVLPPFAGG